ncbi:MAG: twin-arginine translocation signal domain-containing protein, partial [Planctomycetaceae bacterium]|nr:twin-arginine translocation signal domain-containing protein [Planctomycetaceae bacterium]
MKRYNTDRRDFIKTTGIVAGGYWLGTSVPDVSARSANEQLNIACI